MIAGANLTFMVGMGLWAFKLCVVWGRSYTRFSFSYTAGESLVKEKGTVPVISRPKGGHRSCVKESEQRLRFEAWLVLEGKEGNG